MQRPQPSRRAMLQGTAAAAIAATTSMAGSASATAAVAAGVPRKLDIPADRRIYKSLKIDMVREPNLTLPQKFEMLREIGFDGVEINSPADIDLAEAIEARDQTGLAIEGTVNNVHWNIRLSDPDPEVRERGYQAMIAALHETYALGAHSMLLVPGNVTDPENENHEQVWERSTEQILRALPTAAYLGVYIAVENVGNDFLYHEDRSARLFVEYIDQFNSPWLGMHFDIGNHARYGDGAQWIHELNRRIVKLDVKGPAIMPGGERGGPGDFAWPEIRQALDDIGFTGWAAAEVRGGNRDRLRQISENMDRAVLGL